ncbi:MAG: single-stranded DNA-binding protein [Elusimicrobia bacterium]|nr:single-stranded DNA-binding protein [Elusimicrobiota bacterium]
MAAMTLRLHQLNDVRLVGRLTRDPELRFTTKGQAVCRLDLAINRRYKDASGEWKDDTSFVPVVVWRETAQRCSERLKKGSPVYVEGRLRSRAWETKEGQKRVSLEVDCRAVQFLAKMETEPGTEGAEQAAEPVAASPANGSDVSAEESVADESIPF